MLCFVARSVGTQTDWLGRRMGETVGCHSSEGINRILATLYLDNNCEDGEKNYLEILHPGNANATLMTSHPLPDHPDENNIPKNVLSEIYGDAFEIRTEGSRIKQIRQIKALSSWDSWYDLEKPEIVNWAGDERTLDEPPEIKKRFPKIDTEEVTPFTSWTIGPFRKKGPVIISLLIEVEDPLSEGKEIIVDGPEMLLNRIKYEFIPSMPRDKRETWFAKLNEFEEHHIGRGEGYDVVLLGSLFADQVEVVDYSSIRLAPRQLKSKEYGIRYTTKDPNFILRLKYPAGVLTETHKQNVTSPL